LAYPVLYNIVYSYTGFQQAQGDNSFPGTQLDADLSGLQDSIDDLAAFTQGVMRSDGALKNGIVTYDSLAPSLQTAGIATATAWTTGTSYVLGSPVIINSNLYRCQVAHTSGVFATDLAAGKWAFVASLQQPSAPNTIKGNNTGATAAPVDLTGAQVEQMLPFTQNGVGAVQRSLDAKIKDFLNVKDFGATGDGTTNDTAAIQAAITAAIAANAGAVYFPSPSAYYRISSALVMDYSGAYYSANRFGKRVSLVGAGQGTTAILADPGVYAALYILGRADNNTTYAAIKDLRIASSDGGRLAGSIGLFTDKAAYLALDGAIIEGFNVGWLANDTEQVAVRDSEIRYNNTGVIGLTGTVTSPNGWSFYNTLIAGNFVGGLDITNANAFNFNGGSIQYNGFIGDGAGFGAKITNAGNGGAYATVGFSNMAFEGNGGLADLISHQDATYIGVVGLKNCAFTRTVGFFSATVTGAANNGSGLIRLAVNSTAPLAGRSAVNVSGVVGTSEANAATPWAFTIIDATHIDLTGSAFVNAYVSGGIVSVVGYANNNILVEGAAAIHKIKIDASTFQFGTGYAQSATRPIISKTNTNAVIYSSRSNYFASATEGPAAGSLRFEAPYVTGTSTYDPPSLADGASTTTTITATGAALGDPVSIGFSVPLAGMNLTAYVSAADTVTAVFDNESGGVLDLASGTLRAVVFKHSG
jgi:hypothetical protein